MRFTLFLVCFLSVPCFSQNLVDNKGLKQGKWVKFYENSNVPKYEGEFKDNKPIGLFTYYSQDGKVSARMAHLNERSTRVEFYHKNGTVMSDGFYLDQLKDSIWYNYTSDGEISSIESYKANVLHGPNISYYLENENLQAPAVMRTSFYVDGKIDSEYKEFFKSGKLKVEGNYQKGLPVGAWKEYTNSGELYKTYSFKNGQMHGWVKLFDKNASVLSKTFFKEGEPLLDKKLELYLKECAAKNIDPEH